MLLILTSPPLTAAPTITAPTDVSTTAQFGLGGTGTLSGAPVGQQADGALTMENPRDTLVPPQILEQFNLLKCVVRMHSSLKPECTCRMQLHKNKCIIDDLRSNSELASNENMDARIEELTRIGHIIRAKVRMRNTNS